MMNHKQKEKRTGKREKGGGNRRRRRSKANGATFPMPGTATTARGREAARTRKARREHESRAPQAAEAHHARTHTRREATERTMSTTSGRATWMPREAETGQKTREKKQEEGKAGEKTQEAAKKEGEASTAEHSEEDAAGEGSTDTEEGIYISGVRVFGCIGPSKATTVRAECETGECFISTHVTHTHPCGPKPFFGNAIWSSPSVSPGGLERA